MSTSYDNSELGVEHPNHPANEIEVIELSEEEQRIQYLEISIKELKRIDSNMQRLYDENAMSLVSPNGFTPISKYIELKEIFNYKLNKI